MNNLRILGQLLLWTGFLSASLAAVSRQEVDALPDIEQKSLQSLPAAASITRAELEELTGRPVRELSSDELLALVERLQPVLEQRLQIEDQLAAIADRPATSLSPEELQALEQLLPELRERALQRERAATQAELLDEAELGALRTASAPWTRDDLIAQRVFTIENRWLTIPWGWYALSLAVGIAGAFCLRATSKSAISDRTRVEAEYTVIQNSLAQLQQAGSDLIDQLDSLSPSQVVETIDKRFAEPFSDFADARNALIQRFGLQIFADVMTDFSSAERFINRAWSAAADGYMHEVQRCVQTAHHHLAGAAEVLQRAEQDHGLEGASPAR